jgi:acetyl esterase/lipase
MMQWFWDNYTTNPAERRSTPRRSRPAPNSSRACPPRWCRPPNSTLRDEGEGYARHLDAAGVPVTSVRYNGMIHDFGLLNPLSQIPEVKAAVRQAAAELKTHLN